MTPQHHLPVKEQDSPELVFLREIVNMLPAVVFINEILQQGNNRSMCNIWTNQRGLDFMDYSQEEITAMGYEFFTKTMHPDDLEVIPHTVQVAYASRQEPVFVGMHRIRSRDDAAYHWVYCHGVILKTFDDGSPRQMLSIAVEITETMHTETQLAEAMKEINRLRHELKSCCLTRREKEVLSLIVKGKTDKEVAQGLFISITTAKKHRTNLIRKAGVRNSAELVAMAVECGLY